ncbi:hypothetical protein IRJ41_008465 [Triplophysa rosa]|uniref:Uncharacterized protein n=1 Tax=Triplophysa rosa TaxID=992332 RepID=A0A9W7WSY8_TRIRA|nr:hypothetical protein IRJ41_008465 [Triplophysa rosa]
MKGPKRALEQSHAGSTPLISSTARLSPPTLCPVVRQRPLTEWTETQRSTKPCYREAPFSHVTKLISPMLRKPSSDKQEGCHTFEKDTCLTDDINGELRRLTKAADLPFSSLNGQTGADPQSSRPGLTYCVNNPLRAFRPLVYLWEWPPVACGTGSLAASRGMRVDAGCSKAAASGAPDVMNDWEEMSESEASKLPGLTPGPWLPQTRCGIVADGQTQAYRLLVTPRNSGKTEV